MVVEVATVSPKGRPFLTPLWFVVEGDVLYITTGPETRAGRNVAAHPDVTLLFHDAGESAGRVLRLRGRATCHRGLPGWGVLARVAVKYYVGPRALPVELRNARRWYLRRRYYGRVKGGFGHLRVVPGVAEFLPAP
jgi:hypothetical protein